MLRRCAEGNGDAMEEFRRGVADADDTRTAVMGDGLSDESCGIGEVDEPCAGAVLLDNARVIDGGSDGAQRHGNAARAGGFLAGVAILDGGLFVLSTGGDAADTYAVQYKSGISDGLLRRGGDLDAKASAFACDDGATHAGHDLGALPVGIVEHKLLCAELLRGLIHPEDEQRGAASASANDSDFGITRHGTPRYGWIQRSRLIHFYRAGRRALRPRAWRVTRRRRRGAVRARWRGRREWSQGTQR